MNWIKQLDDDTVPTLTAGVQGVVERCRCELDLLNGGFSSTVTVPFSESWRLAILNAKKEMESERRHLHVATGPSRGSRSLE
jgi:hypothetical protein